MERVAEGYELWAYKAENSKKRKYKDVHEHF